MSRLLAVWAPAVIWAALIFVLSAQPDLQFIPDDNVDFVVRKVGHAGVFGILALLILHATEARSLPRPRTFALVLTAFYAVTDEFHQAFVAGRHASGIDVAIDVAGALLAIAALAMVAKIRG